MVSLDGNNENILKQLINYESQYMESLAELNIYEEQKQYFTSKLSDDEKSFIDQIQSSITPRLSALRSEIALKEAELVRNSNLYGENHEAVINMNNNIIRLKEKLNEEAKKLINQGMIYGDPVIHRQEIIQKVLELEVKKSEQEVKSKEFKKLVDNYNLKLKD